VADSRPSKRKFETPGWLIIDYEAEKQWNIQTGTEWPR
jgi:hypothetical protein